MKIVAKIWRLADMLIPRFIEEYVAVERDKAGGIKLMYSWPKGGIDVIDPRDLERVEGVVKARMFNLFGIGLFVKYEATVIPLKEWLAKEQLDCKVRKNT